MWVCGCVWGGGCACVCVRACVCLCACACVCDCDWDCECGFVCDACLPEKAGECTIWVLDYLHDGLMSSIGSVSNCHR